MVERVDKGQLVKMVMVVAVKKMLLVEVDLTAWTS